jgi:hypothetical protein
MNLNHRFLPIIGAAAAALLAGSAQGQAIPVIPTNHIFPASAVVAGKVGFIWNVSEVAAGEPNQLAWAEGQLAGLKGPNLADPSAVSVASGPAQAANPPTAPISFTIPGVINLSKTDGSTKGNFTPDLLMPGIPGTTGSSDNIAAEVLTYLQLPAGTNTMAVNSDDGFRVTIGGANPHDPFAVNVGQYDGGRGANDTVFQFVVAQAGIYSARLLYENGGGDANVEWFTINGTNKVLINDLTGGGIPAYTTLSVSQAYVQQVVPAPSASGVFPDQGVHVTLSAGSTPIADGSIVLSLDGTVVTPKITKSGSVTQVDYSTPAPFPSASTHSASFQYSEGSLVYSNSWSFTVQNYTTLDSSWAVTNVDTTKPGFNWNIFANPDSANQVNSNERAENNLSLLAVDANGVSLPNLANPASVGAASGPGVAPSAPNSPVHFEILGTIALDIATNSLPGAPSTDGSTDGQAAEAITYLSLPAGVVDMEIVSDDGWRLYSGTQPADVLSRSFIAEHNDGTGPVQFSFVAPKAGVYPFRLVWENGTGGSSLTWNSIDASGTRILVNDVAHGGIPAYRALTAGSAVHPYIVGISPVPAIHQMEVANTNLTVVLVDGSTAINDASITLTIDGKSVTPIKSRQGKYVTVTDGGTGFPGLQLPSDVHTAVITYADASGSYTRTQTWSFNNIQVLVLPAKPVVAENFDSYPEATSVANTVPPGWTAWNYTQDNTAGWDLTDKSSEPYKNWVIITADHAVAIEGSALSNDPTQTINGQSVTDFASGNVLWATSDGRSGPQVQFAISAPFDLSSVVNPVLTYSSLMRASGNANAQTDGIEYSIDDGKTWLPGVIYVTIAYGNEGYIKLTPDGSVDVLQTLNAPFSVIGTWVDPVTHQLRGGNFGSGLAEPITQSLASYIAPRSQHVATSTKVDGIRLPLASKQKNVRLRFYQLGNCSWWWGVDNLAFYDIAPPVVPVLTPHIDSIELTGGSITVKWSNGGTLEASPTLNNPTWTTTGSSSGAFSESAAGVAKYYRVRQ